MLLPHHLIEKSMADGDLVITPYTDELLQPASVDLQLGFDFTSNAPSWELEPIDPLVGVKESQLRRTRRDYGTAFILRQGDFVLANTLQWIELPDRLQGWLSGKSTLARNGFSPHVTAGFVDPGFKGQLTLEMTNVNPRPILLWPEMLIAQISFTLLVEPVTLGYGNAKLGSHYQGQTGAREAAPLKRI